MHKKQGMLTAVFSFTVGVFVPAASVTSAQAQSTVSTTAITPPPAVTASFSLDCNTRSDTTASMSTTHIVAYAGKDITLTVPNQPRGYSHVQVRQKIQAAIDNINTNAHKISSDDIKIVQNINHIVLSDMISRSGIEEKSGAFFLKISEVMRQGVGYLSSNIAHDSFHVEQYKRGGYAASRSTQAEVDAIEFQLRLMPALAIEAKGARFLRTYQKDHKAINTRRQPGQCD